MAVRTEQIMQLLVSTREDILGKLDNSDLAKSQFSRDVIPSQNSSFKPKGESATVQRARIINETNIVADTLSSKFPWMYQKPADEKGDTKIVKRAEDQIQVAKETEKETKASGTKLGKMLGLLGTAATLFVIFKDEIIKGFKFVVSNFGSIIKFLGEKIFSVMQWLWDKIWPVLKPLAEKIWAGLQWLGGWIMDGLKAVGGFLASVFGNVKEFLGAKVEALGGIIHDGYMILKNSLSKAFSVGWKTLVVQILRLPLLIAAKTGKVLSKVMMLPFQGIISLIGMIPGVGKHADKVNANIDAGRDAVFDFLDGPNIDTTKNFFSNSYDKNNPTNYRESLRGNIEALKSGTGNQKPLPALGIEAPSLSTIKNKFSTSTSSSRTAISNFERKMISARNTLDEAFGGAKPLDGLKPTSLPEQNKTDGILLSSEEVLKRIEQNTRGGMGGSTIVAPGQRGKSTNNKGNNSVATNLNAGTGGPKKIDSRGGYVRSPYSVTPNTLIT
jgi:hypothetical protein